MTSRIVTVLNALCLLLLLFVHVCAQSSEPSQLPDCTSETERFLAQRQDEIEREALAQHDVPEAGVYHATGDGGLAWLLIWAPKSGFVAYHIPDAPCPAFVTYGTVRFDRGKLRLTPKVPFYAQMGFIFAKDYRVISYEGARFLVPSSRVKQFYRARRSGRPEVEDPYLSQQKSSDSWWRDDPIAPN